MKDPTLEPLEPDVAAALAGERRRPGPGPAVRLRAHARLLTALAVPETAFGDGPNAGGPPLERGDPDLIPTDLDAVPTRTVAGDVIAALRAHPLVASAVGFACGLASGFALHAHLSSPTLSTPTTVLVESRTTTERPVTRPSAESESSPLPAASTMRGHARAQAAPIASADLQSERALLDVARAARGRGDSAAALQGLERHRKQFPRGVFREEREALEVLSLRDAGRLDEARERAVEFRARYPKSLFLVSVQRVLEPLPR